MGFYGILWNFMEFYGALSDVSHDTNQYFVFQWLYIYMEYIGTLNGFNGILWRFNGI